jgi:hypothetical protein
MEEAFSLPKDFYDPSVNIFTVPAQKESFVMLNIFSIRGCFLLTQALIIVKAANHHACDEKKSFFMVKEMRLATENTFANQIKPGNKKFLSLFTGEAV